MKSHFGSHIRLKKLYLLYLSLNATPGKVLVMPEEPEADDKRQAWVFTYLQQFIGNVRNDKVH